MTTPAFTAFSETHIHPDIHLPWILDAGRDPEKRRRLDATETRQVRVVRQVVDAGIQTQLVPLAAWIPSGCRGRKRDVVGDPRTGRPHGRRAQAPDPDA